MSTQPAAKKSDEAEQEAWLITYADAITLINLFFLLLLSMASFDPAKFQEAAEGITRDIAKKEYTAPISLLKAEVQDIAYEAQADQAVNVESSGRGLSIELSSGAFYRPASAEIRDEAVPVLTKIAETLKAPRYAYYMFSVEGHSDDVPISTPRYPSNWELSTARATTVVRFFLEHGLDPEKLRAVGFAETRPKAVNRDASGAPIPANQALNRRVSIEVTPMSVEEKKKFQMKAAAQAQQAPRASIDLAPGSNRPNEDRPAEGGAEPPPRQ
jgi:chemotaxis protein MotB